MSASLPGQPAANHSGVLRGPGTSRNRPYREEATTDKARIAHVSGPRATIQNTPPLVTSNKARAKRGLPLRQNVDGTVPVFDALRAQRLAAPVKVYVEQFSAHPLEADAAELYGPPDGYLGADGVFSRERDRGGQARLRGRASPR